MRNLHVSRLLQDLPVISVVPIIQVCLMDETQADTLRNSSLVPLKIIF